MKWVTRERPRIDRVACAWLIKRFIDPDPTFLFVPNDQVSVVAEREGATPFHVRGGPFGRSGDETGFDVIARAHELTGTDVALDRLAKIIRGADVALAETPPESAGLRAIMNGFVDVYTDDHVLLEHATPVYEALYAWCRRQAAGGRG
jgi:hypothetical protein